MIELLCWQIVLVYLIDCSGFTESLKLFISKHLTGGKIETTNFSLKPFTCSLCMVWWCGLAYLLLTNQFTVYYLLWVCILSFLTPVTKDILFIVRDVLTYLVNKIQPNDK